MKYKLYFFFLLLLYYFMYTPPFRINLGIGMDIILIIVSFLYMFIHRNEHRNFINNFKLEYSLLLFILFFCIIRSCIEVNFLPIFLHTLSILYVFVVIPFVFMCAKRIGVFKEKDIIRSILIASSIAACLSMFCAISPVFNAFIKNKVVLYEEGSYLIDNEVRGFGVASLLTSHYGYIQGTVAVLGLYYIKNNKWFLFFIPLVLLSALLNARTGILIALIGFLILSFYYNKIIILPIMIIGSGVVYYLPEILELLNLNEGTLRWIREFNDLLLAFYTGEKSIGEYATFSSMIIWPSSAMEWILGRGISLYDMKNSLHSDVGWIIQLNYGGLIYLILFVLFLVVMAMRLWRLKKKVFMCLFISIVVIVNTKSRIVPGLGGEFGVLMLIYCLIVINATKNMKMFSFACKNNL